MAEDEEPKVKTLRDKGATIDHVTLSDGRELFILKEEKFRGADIGGFKLGWSDKYQIISPRDIGGGTLNIMTSLISSASGVTRMATDFRFSITTYLRCKTCGIEFASGISTDKKSFETMALSKNQHTCPKGHTHAYDKKDYYFKE